MYMSATYI